MTEGTLGHQRTKASSSHGRHVMHALPLVLVALLSACTQPTPTSDPFPTTDQLAEVPELVSLLEDARGQTEAAAQSVANGHWGPPYQAFADRYEEVQIAFNSFISSYKAAVELGADPAESYAELQEAADLADGFVTLSEEWETYNEANPPDAGGANAAPEVGGALGAPETAAKVIAALLPAIIEAGNSVWNNARAADQALRDRVAAIVEQQRWRSLPELGIQPWP